MEAEMGDIITYDYLDLFLLRVETLLSCAAHAGSRDHCVRDIIGPLSVFSTQVLNYITFSSRASILLLLFVYGVLGKVAYSGEHRGHVTPKMMKIKKIERLFDKL